MYKSKINNGFFQNQLAEVVFYRTYSRWNDEYGRRETWEESVQRYMQFMRENIGNKLTEHEYGSIHDAILSQQVMPSMRLMWTAGKAARANHISTYNCAFIAPTKPKDIAEILYVTFAGSGIGFSVEQKFVDQFPLVWVQNGKINKHTVADTRDGWAIALELGLESWFKGEDIEFDYSKIRPKGSVLKTMGGMASGAEPLKNVIDYARSKILDRQGKKLRTIDVHDIICKIGEEIQSGESRRAAMISLSDLEDANMEKAKEFGFWEENLQRSYANNSAVYSEKPEVGRFMREFGSLISNKTGERGIFNKYALNKQMPQRRVDLLGKHIDDIGVNPCGEIYLQSKQFCNLTVITVRSDDTFESLQKKIEIATIIGTYQATLTDFTYLSKEWKENCEKERLLGVAINGYFDNDIVRAPNVLANLKELSIKTNELYARRFGINQSSSVTCIKPAGNTSQLLNTASGMHPRFSKYYIRRIRIGADSAIAKLLIDQNVPHEAEIGNDPMNPRVWVFEFPVASPENSLAKEDLSAVELLNEWLKIKMNFTEHNPSATIYVKENEWIEVADWVYKNLDYIGGLSFLQADDHAYDLAPFESITKEKYEELEAKMPIIDFSKLPDYESRDLTEGNKELACVAGQCEI